MGEVTLPDLQRQVFHLRQAGVSFDEISDRLNISEAEVIIYFRQYTTKIASSYSLDERETMIHLELERLDRLQLVAWDQAMAGDLKAVEAVLKVMMYRGKLLQLDALNPHDAKNLTQILVVGNDRKAFLDALEQGQRGLTGSGQDDESDQQEAS